MDAIKKFLRMAQVFLAVLWLGTSLALAQNPLERKVSVTKKQTKVKEILQEIENKAHLSFSYNPEQIQDEKVLDIQFENKPVRFILDRIFKGWVDYRAKGNYIILQPTRKPPVPEPRFQKIRISGYVLDDESGTYLNGVSIYDSISFNSVVSNVNGHFEMELSENSNALYLMVKKQGYRDTAYFIPREGFQSVELRLKPVFIPVTEIVVDSQVVVDSTQQADTTTLDTARRDWKKEVKEDFEIIRGMVNEKLRFNAVNINDTFFRKFQFSVVPGVSTNKLLGGSVVNDYSLNLLGGYSKGVNVLEVGGIFNLDEGDVKFAQAAGIFNAVGGNVTGFQGAGICNLSGGKVYGAQTAGIFNLSEGPLTGFQGAGIFNITEGSVFGAQAAGIFNVSEGPITGFQAAGIFNVSEGSVHGVQAAGIFNAQDSLIEGAQVAGIFNTNELEVRGAQVAGIWNGAERVNGIQIAGIFNAATYVRGAQIGLLNFSDSIDGVPIGLFSYSKKGYHKWEIGADELFYTRTALRSGSHWFHNILQVGIDPRTTTDPLWFAGYGLGTSIPVRRSYFDIDLSSNYIGKGNPKPEVSILSQLYLGMDFYLAKKVSLAAGVTANVFVVDQDHPNFAESFNPLFSGVIDNSVSDDYRIQSWVGGKVAIRFF